MAKVFRKQQVKLAARRAAFDNMKRPEGHKRPGSMNRKKGR